MSIIIKGLNLPPISDTNGIINLSIDCYGQVVVSNTQPTKILKAEQILIHGRLIDVDALMGKIEADTPLSDVFEKLMRRYCNIAPTIIEAEDDTI